MPPRRANPTETEKRLERIEAAINDLAFFEGRFAPIREGVCPELDAIRREYHGRAHWNLETRPQMADETREQVNA